MSSVDDETPTSMSARGAGGEDVVYRDESGLLAARNALANLDMTADARASVEARGRVLDNLVLAHSNSNGLLGAPGSIPVLTREDRERMELQSLAPLATRSSGAGIRALPEEPDAFRTCFEKDADRIRYATAFRRLAGKCQVFVAPKNDHLRNRLTHALETTQVAVAVARAVGLNVSLVEAMALGHDCGHGPTGHACEEALSIYLPEGFDHAPYGADVTLTGLNLCAETLDGIRNHSWKRPAPSTPEAELLSYADRVAYVAHDFADACLAGIVTAADVPPLMREAAGVRHSDHIHFFVSRLVATIRTHGRVGLDRDTALVLDEFRTTNFERIYLRPESRTQAERSVMLLRALTERFIAEPQLMPDVASRMLERPQPGSLEACRLAVDYVSGMTDRFAISLGVEMLNIPRSQLPQGA